jgi:hypothetical protein
MDTQPVIVPLAGTACAWCGKPATVLVIYPTHRETRWGPRGSRICCTATNPPTPAPTPAPAPAPHRIWDTRELGERAELGHTIRTLRVQLGLSQLRIAEMLTSRKRHYNQATVSLIEKGDCAVPLAKATALAEALHTIVAATAKAAAS